MMPNDLLAKLRTTRLVATPWSTDPARGVGSDRIRTLLERWRSGYDWSGAEQRIADLPWQTVELGGSALRVVHQRAAIPDAPVVVLLHGWPDSVLRFERVLPLLEDVHVVVPALPGFPFAAPTSEAATSANQMAGIVGEALDHLGYPSYVLSGGDVGGTVAEIIAGEHPERVTALHLTNIAPRRALTADRAHLSADAGAYVDQTAQWFRANGGYIAEQSTRPNTLAVALGDSPAGLLAWLAEKLDAWSDKGAFTDDDLLTWVTAYWTTGTIGTSFATYVEPVTLPDRIRTPTVLSVFPHDLKPEPRSYAAAFVDLQEYVEHTAGGHFAAWERPAAYADDLLRAVAIGGGGRAA